MLGWLPCITLVEKEACMKRIGCIGAIRVVETMYFTVIIH